MRWHRSRLEHRYPSRGARTLASGRDLIEQRRIVVACTGLVDPPRHRPHAKAILRGGPQNLYSDLPVQPWQDVSLIKHHRHSVVSRPRQFIGIRDDDRARSYTLAGLWILPSVP